MNQTGTEWIEVCAANEIDLEDVIRFDHGDQTFAVYRSDEGDYYATDGYCTHERFHLSDGLVIGCQIECPKHNGRLDLKTGEPKRVPICKRIKTYPVTVKDGKVFIKIE